jgi:GTPase SAR1 family protein
MKEVQKHGAEGVNKILIGNKIDLEGQRKITTEEGQALASELNIPFIETSAKLDTKVEESFLTMSREIKARVQKNPTTKTNPRSIKGGKLKTSGKKKDVGCCN